MTLVGLFDLRYDLTQVVGFSGLERPSSRQQMMPTD
jgi:hypothetical protein